jgi:hypothetical protein
MADNQEHSRTLKQATRSTHHHSGHGGDMPGPQPSWQREPCPAWCVREHDEDDIPLDRYHQSEPSVLPVLASERPEEPHGNRFAPVDLTIRIGRYVGEVVDWVAIEPIALSAPRVVLTAESAHRLAQRVEEQLERAVADE